MLNCLPGVEAICMRWVVDEHRSSRPTPCAQGRFHFGAWRSLAAHLLWEQRVVGSNPTAPRFYKIMKHQNKKLSEKFITASKTITYLVQGDMYTPFTREIDKLNWKGDELYAVHNGEKILMGWVYPATLRDDEWYAILEFRGIRETRLPFQQEKQAREWIVEMSKNKLKEWRKRGKF